MDSSTRAGLDHRATLAPMFMAVAALAAGLLPGAGAQGNEMCWYNSGRTYEECCVSEGRSLEAEEACWRGTWFSEELCCHALPPGYQQCFEDIEERVLSKVEFLERWEATAAAGKLEPNQEELLQAVGRHIEAYRHLVAQPLTLWSYACAFPASPLLWSKDCACCDPKDQACTHTEKEAVLHPAHAQCCYPLYARWVLEPPDERLEAAIQAHLGSATISRHDIVHRGSRLKYLLANQLTANGCVISLRGGRILPCDERHACPRFDCSYLRALVLTLTVIQGVKPLPDMDLLLNAGDVTLDAFDATLPTFTRVGTRWTNTVQLPPEWQLHPGQCSKHLKIAATSAESIPWARRRPVLVWRGSNSNCFMPACSVASASDANMTGPAAEACGRMDPGRARDCTWNASTWLRMPRGRLVWLSRFTELVDARFVLSRHLAMAPELEEFLRAEGLISDEPMGVEEQAHYKYAIAVEGDSAPDRAYWQLFTGSVLLLPDGPWQVYAVHGLLEPFVHYVPVRYDLGDLLEKVTWLREHDEKARSIAQRAATFARRYLSCDGVVRYVDRLLRAYAQRLSE
uniref:Glycosyl transferase CAP10 domain-containing protein n=1 Tax=Alexandrium monilatum TaxID=311494 RepID=A0A7S4VG91_9DINO